MNRYKFAVNSLSEIHRINHYSSMVQKGLKSALGDLGVQGFLFVLVLCFWLNLPLLTLRL